MPKALYERIGCTCCGTRHSVLKNHIEVSVNAEFSFSFEALDRKKGVVMKIALAVVFCLVCVDVSGGAAALGGCMSYIW